MNKKIFLLIIVIFGSVVGGTLFYVQNRNAANDKPVTSVEELEELQKEVDQHVEDTKQLTQEN